jgi:hypothetical protein
MATLPPRLRRSAKKLGPAREGIEQVRAGACGEIRMSQSRAAGGPCHGCGKRVGQVAAGDDPLVVLIAHYSADETDHCLVVGEDAREVLPATVLSQSRSSTTDDGALWREIASGHL